MEMVAQLNSEDGEARIVIPSPGRGYLTNWVILLTTASEETFEWGRMIIGYHPLLYDIAIDAEGVGARAMGPIDFTLTDMTATVNRWMSKKKIHLDYSDKLVIHWQGGTTDVNIVIQATFVPKKNSILRARRTSILTGVTTYVEANKYMIPHNVQLIGIRSILTVTEATLAGVHRLSYKHYDKNSGSVLPAITNKVGDVQSAVLPPEHSLIYGRDELCSHHVGTEINRPHSYEFMDKMKVGMAKGDFIIPWLEVVTPASSGEADVAKLETEYFMIFRGDPDREFIEEYLVIDGDWYMDHGYIASPNKYGGEMS